MTDKKSVFFFIILFLATYISAQETTYFKGFTQKISPVSFGYHSPLPDVKTSLLIRGKKEFGPISWETEAVPTTFQKEYVHFIWMYGKDVTHMPSTFHLSFNGKELLSFKNSGKGLLGEEMVNGNLGSLLTFNNTMIDKYGDQMGFAVLRVPLNLIRKGKSNEITVSSEPENQDTWYMTFEAALQPSLDIRQNMVVIKEGDKRWHNVVLEILHLGPEEEIVIHIEDNEKTGVLQTGYNRLDVNMPMVEGTTPYEAEIKIGDRKEVVKNFSMAPVKEWEVYLVQHTHSDIGYTRPQSEILGEHLRYIDHALDYCDATDHYDNEAKFRWTCETLWSVKEYLQRRPQKQIDRLIARLKEGRIEATGMFLNFSEIIDEAAIAYQTKYLRMLKNQGIEVTTAMQNDVNGAAWSFIDIFKETGVKYLTMGLHGHRARKPFGQPTAFWWESPAENRLLAYRGEHYQHGNTLRLISGSQDVFCNNLTNYLEDLEKKNYPYDKVSLQFSGYVTDNSPPSTKVCDIIKEWNEKYEWPKLRSALAKDFMIYLDEEIGDEIQKRKEAWPDWWTDGTGSATNETMVARNVHNEINITSTLLSLAALENQEIPLDIHDQIEAIYDNLLFYDEHTFGAAESIRDPLSTNSVNQWNMKSAYVWDALKRVNLLQEQALAYLTADLPEYEKPSIVVYNTLNWSRHAMVKIFIDQETIPEGAAFTLRTQDHKEVPVEIVEQRVEGAYYNLWIEDLPPLGYKTVIIHMEEESNNQQNAIDSPFENQYYRIDIDTDQGGIVALYDKSLGINLIDEKSKYSLGQVIHEKLKNRHDLERLTAALRDTVFRPLDQEYTTISNLEIIGTAYGPIYKSIRLHGDLPITADNRGIDMEIRLFHHEKKIDLLYRMVKLDIQDPEGLYVSFPFFLPDGQLFYEVQGGVISPGKNQLPGSASDWNTIQNFASVKNDEAQIIFVSNEIPLVQFGDLNIGRYYYQLNPKTNHIYSWVLNNYWVTNFKASQEGELRWKYSITSTDNLTDKEAIRFGRNNRMSSPARLVSKGSKTIDYNSLEYSFLDFNIPNLLVVNCTPALDNTGIILHLRETAGNRAIIDIQALKEKTAAKAIQRVNAMEEEMKKITSPLQIEPYETLFLKLTFE